MNARLWAWRPPAMDGEILRPSGRFRVTNTYAGGSATRGNHPLGEERDCRCSSAARQIDDLSGEFSAILPRAYLEDGKVGVPIKGATLIGNGPDAMTRVAMIGNDSKLDPGIGTCGKNGQSVPVGVGQPTLRIDGLTVGSTAA